MKKIILITHYHPSEADGDGNFILPELKVLKKFLNSSDTFPEFTIEIWPSSSNPNEEFQENICDFRVKNYLGIMRQKLWKSRKIRIFFTSFFYLNQLLKSNRKSSLRNFKTDLIILFNWLDQKIVMSKVLENLTRFEKSEIVCFYTYWLDGHTSAITEFKFSHQALYKISRAHGGDLYVEQNLQINQAKTCKNLDQVFAASLNGALSLVKQGCDPNNIQVSHLGIEKFEYGSQNKFQAKSIDQSVIKLVAIARPHPVKQMGLLVSQLQEISSAEQKIELHILGYEESDLVLENLNPDLSVIFHGRLRNSNVRSRLASEHFLAAVNMSISEATPVSLMEAIQVGIPLVGRDIGGISEIVKTGITGYLLTPTSDSSELNTALLYIKENYAHLSKSALTFWRNNFDSENVYVNFYSKLLEKLNLL